MRAWRITAELAQGFIAPLWERFREWERCREWERFREWERSPDRKFGIVSITFALWFALSANASAQDAISEHKPFAEAHVILQVSNADPDRYRAVLDIANNLSKHYGGQDMVDIEIISFAAGVSLMFSQDNPNASRISSLMEHGVRFYVCGNTLDSIERKQHKRPGLLSGVEVVPTGVAFMIDEINRGYTPIHP